MNNGQLTVNNVRTTSEFQLIDTDKLIPYVNNARTHSTEQINKLRASLREFGFINPVIVDKDLNVIAGHGRIAAAKAEGIKKVPCVFVDHLTDAQKKAYILVDNRMAMDAGWDEELLRVETDRSALVAGYLGQTAIKTQKVIQQAMGGVLFIDEAYSLAGENDDSYGKEAVETILKAMEDHRDELVVIVAGYTELMHKFIDSNLGLSSRFSKYFEFPDYTGDELILIFERFCSKNGYALTQEARSILKDHFDFLFISRDEHFGNARTARNIFEKSINAQANRIASAENINDSDLENITAEDILASIGGAAK